MLAERFDARQSARLVPVWAAAAGVGAAIGGLAAVPVARLGGAGAALGGAALIWAAIAAVRLGGAGRLAPAGRGRRAWGDGLRAVARYPLARQLAILVAAGGCFASLAYYVLGATAAAHVAGTAHLAGFLGAFRGAVQAATLVAQLVLAPRLLARLGIGGALVLAPLGALATGLGLVGAGTLIAAAALQGQAKFFDASVETPAEKLAQNLLPVAVRGRIAGFLDGAAKRLGAVTGALVAALLAGVPRTLAIVDRRGRGGVAAGRAPPAPPPARARGRRADRGAAARRRRPATATIRWPRSATASSPRSPPSSPATTRPAPPSSSARLHARGRTDAIARLARAAAAAPADQRAGVLGPPWPPPPRPGSATGPARRRRSPRPWRTGRARAPTTRRRSSRWSAPSAWSRRPATPPRWARWATSRRCRAAAAAAARTAAARIAGDAAAIDDAIADALDDDDRAVRAAGARDLRAELGRAADPARAPRRAFLDCAHRLVRVARRPRRVDDATRAACLDALGGALIRLRGHARPSRSSWPRRSPGWPTSWPTGASRPWPRRRRSPPRPCA